jgi:hypothetical protein
VVRFQLPTRQGENCGHVFKTSRAHPAVLSVWHPTHGLGIFNVSVEAGVMKRNVWLRTFTSAIVCWIFGIWQATHSFPADPSL